VAHQLQYQKAAFQPGLLAARSLGQAAPRQLKISLLVIGIPNGAASIRFNNMKTIRVIIGLAVIQSVCSGCVNRQTGNVTYQPVQKVAKAPTPKPTLRPKPTSTPTSTQLRQQRAEARRRERAARKEARRIKREHQKRMAAERKRAEDARGKVRKYSIVKREDSSISGLTRFTYRVLVPENIRAVDVEPTSEKIIEELRNSNPEIDEIALFLYNRAPVEGVYTVAAVDWAPNGEWGSTTLDIADSNDRSNYKIKIEAATNLP
jgi:hypothetical protein